MSDPLDWQRTCHRRLMVGLHVPDHDQLTEYRELQEKYGLADIMSRLDAKQYARDLREAHIQLFWYYTKCHYGNAYYPSKVGHVHSCCKDRDIFGELTEACLSEGIIPGAVYECSDGRMRKDHPDWCHKIPSDPTQGGDMTDADQGARVAGPCLNGPYGDFMIEQTREVLKEYPIKAYNFDFLGLFGFETWRCPYCGPKLKRDTGIDFRTVDLLSHDEYVAYVRWRYAQVEAYSAKVMKIMRDLRPDVAITHNLHAIGGGAGMQRMDFASKHGDFLFKDMFNLRSGMLQMSWCNRTMGANTRCAPAEALLDSLSCVAGDLQTLKAVDGLQRRNLDRARLQRGSLHLNGHQHRRRHGPADFRDAAPSLRRAQAVRRVVQRHAVRRERRTPAQPRRDRVPP